MTTTAPLGRTYNQPHVPRKYAPGKRRFSVYWTWSYPFEANRDVDCARQSLFDDDRSPARRVARLRNERIFGRRCSYRGSPERSNCSISRS